MSRPALERAMLGRTEPGAGGREMEIDAGLIATGLGLEPAQVQALMQTGKITVLCERGTGEDLGCHRITFHHAGRRFRILIDASGRIFASA